MHKDKEENSHRDSHYRAREMAALAAYDHHHLDGEMFLQEPEGGDGGKRVDMREASEEKELPDQYGRTSGARPRRVQPSLHTPRPPLTRTSSSPIPQQLAVARVCFGKTETKVHQHSRNSGWFVPKKLNKTGPDMQLSATSDTFEHEQVLLVFMDSSESTHSSAWLIIIMIIMIVWRRSNGDLGSGHGALGLTHAVLVPKGESFYLDESDFDRGWISDGENVTPPLELSKAGLPSNQCAASLRMRRFALNGFLLILTCDGEVFFATHSIENYLGFHQRLDIRGRVKVLHGQNKKTEEPPLALFALCTPFGPPSLLEVPQKEVMFKSKHKLDFALVSMDQRGQMLLGYTDAELTNLGGYDLVHYDDLAYVASAHQELLKTGASGMIAYRYQMKDGGWQWLQTSSRLVYKNSKPDFVISTHRPLMEEEGRDLLGKRTMDFKVSYLDAGLTNSYFSDNDSLTGPSMTPTLPAQPTPQRVNRRYKTQLRDFLSTCRSKRTKLANQSSSSPPSTPTVASVDYLAADTSAAAAVAAAYSNLNTIYPTPYAPSAVAATSDPSLTTYIGHTGNYHQTLYPASALDNRYLTTENLFQYRPLGSYYPDYHSTTAYNGFIDVSLPTYDTHQLAGSKAEERLYCQQLESPKYGYVDSSARHPNNSPYAASPVTTASNIHQNPEINMGVGRAGSRHSLEGASSSNSAGSSPVTAANGVRTPKIEDVKPDVYGSEAPRQTVLMWGPPPRSPPKNNGSYSPPTPHSTHSSHSNTNVNVANSDPLKSLAEMNSLNGDCKWKTSPNGGQTSPPRKNHHQNQNQNQSAQNQGQYPVTSHSHYGGYSHHQGHHGDTGEVWQGVQHHHYQYYPYHHHHPAPPRHTPHTSPSSAGTGTDLGGSGMDIPREHSNTTISNSLYHQSHHAASSVASIVPAASQIPNRTPGVLCCPSLR
ncbi:hypothetical protein G9C98_000053 [Cotesia typhae]|uniref:PAS fold-3 domain-containing protein n=1 Tax=Cotesia typhae TaxID=2053667 RepID=A0A8J5UTV7_9HYME|nr:hypothetical protein G9C98_000053 [Cotesia typhae]